MIAEIVGGITTASLVGTVIWLVHGRIKSADHAADARIAQIETETHIERVQFELEVTKQALKAANARAAALEGVLADDVPTSRDLSPADWRGRLLRITQAWGNSGDVAAPVADAVPPQVAASSAEPGEPF